MAFAATTVWEVRTTGSDSNGGGYSSGGVDYSQQDSAQVALTDMVIDGTANTKFTSATLGSSDNYLGNTINVTGGTGFTVQRVQIVSRAGSVYTCDKSLGTLSSTGGTGNLGGALASVGPAAAVATQGNTVFVKYSATVYTISSTTQNASGGPANFVNAYVSTVVRVHGYDTTRSLGNTDTNRPTFQIASAGVSSVSVFNSPSYGQVLYRNLIVDGNSKTSITAFNGSNGGNCTNCKSINCTTGFAIHAQLCWAESCGSGFTATAIACVAKSCTTYGFSYRGSFCIADSCATGFYSQFWGYYSCIAYNSTSDGFKSDYCRGAVSAANCIAYLNGGYGFRELIEEGQGLLFNCAGYNNTSGNVKTASYPNTATQRQGFVTLTANPFTNPGSGDFSLNNTAGGGAACRAAGFPGALPGGTTTGYLDIGAVQHQDSGGSGGMGVLIGAGGGLIR